MKKTLLLFLIAIMIVGCSSNKEMNKNEIMEANSSKLPKVEAFQDETTRQYMYSTEEVQQGYYLFESMTGKYTMDFPQNGIVMDSIKSENDRMELVTCWFTFDDESLSPKKYEFTLNLRPLENGKEADMRHMYNERADFDYKSKIEKVETDDTIIYHALLDRDQHDGSIRHHVSGVIEAKEISQMIYFDAKLGLYPKDDRLSGAVLEKARSEIFELVEKVHFTKEEE